MKRQCMHCGNWFWLICELRSIYAVHGYSDICSACGSKAGKPVGYFGIKTKEEIHAVTSFLNQGYMIQRKLSAQMNAGYFSDTGEI